MSIVNTKNAARLAKFGMDSAATTAFLASAVIAIGIATKAIAISSLPASLGFLGALATPLGITILLGVAVYFFLSAFASLQQLQENKDLKANINAQAEDIKKVEDSIEAQAENIKKVEASVEAQAKKALEEAIIAADIPSQAKEKVGEAITEQNLVTQTTLNSALDQKADKSELKDFAAKADVEGLKTQMNDHNTALGEKASKGDLITLTTVLDNGKVEDVKTALGLNQG